MAIDERRIKQFIEESDTRRSIAAVVRRAGFRITWVRSHRHELWGFYLRPDDVLQDLLGTSREILLWVSEYDDFQARALTQAMEIIDSEQPRLCEDIAIILTGDNDTLHQVSEASITSQTHFVGFPLSSCATFVPYGDKSFVHSLQQQFFTKDLYNLSGAITNRRAFFGRGGLIKQIVSTLATGSSHVALFGLRKTGKTSLLYRIIDLLRASKELLHAHIDLQRLDSISPTAEYFLWSIGEQLYVAHAAVRAVQGLRLFGKYSMFSDIPDRGAVVELFDHDMRVLLTKTRRRFLLMFDEIELMSPEAPGSSWSDAYVRCWRLLRGLDQTHPGRLRYLVAGTNPRCVEVNQLSGKENPTYNYFSKQYLGPLTQQESEELTSTLGHRMGLDWDGAALLRVHNIVGGHPFLLRAFCSRVHRELLPRDKADVVAVRRVITLVPEVLVEVNSTLSQMVEVLEGQYSNEYYLLQLLAAGKLGEFREMASEFPDDVAHLKGYGLISHGIATSGLTVEILQTWLQRRTLERGRMSSPDSPDRFAPGVQIDNYQFEAAIGRPGGFGTVYRARSAALSDSTVALKVFRDGSLASLQREIDVLREVSHPGIVKILDFGSFSSGEVYLAMEFLSGPTLAEHCTRATRLRGAETTRVLRRLLEALCALHPDSAKLDELREKAELSVSEYRELEVARHGYVHRDIKPENVVLVEIDRPVLIDFNISVRVASPVRTISATPGYIPPDGVVGAWTPDIDLYQLGLTMLQVATGITYDGDNVNDLRQVATSELSDSLTSTLLRLTAASREERYRSAQEALSSLR